MVCAVLEKIATYISFANRTVIDESICLLLPPVLGTYQNWGKIITKAVHILAFSLSTRGWPYSMLKAHPFYERKAKVGSTFFNSVSVSGYLSVTVLFQRLRNA